MVLSKNLVLNSKLRCQCSRVHTKYKKGSLFKKGHTHKTQPSKRYTSYQKSSTEIPSCFVTINIKTSKRVIETTLKIVQ